MGQLEDMQVFVRVVDSGGISRAAEQLSIAKSAISRRLNELEKRLGVTLINRTTRTSKITEAGQHYYDHALLILDEVNQLNSSATQSKKNLEGTLRLSAPLSFGLAHLAPALDSFAKQHPELTLDVDFSDYESDLIQGGFDLAFRIGDLSDSSLKARRICPIRFSICASPEYLEKQGTPETIHELKHHQILRYAIKESNTWTLYDSSGKKHSIQTPAKIIANNGDYLCQMAVCGHGIIIIPTFITWQSEAKGDLVKILRNYSLPKINAYAIYPHNRYLPQRVRLFIDHLIEKFGDNPYWDQI